MSKDMPRHDKDPCRSMCKLQGQVKNPRRACRGMTPSCRGMSCQGRKGKFEGMPRHDLSMPRHDDVYETYFWQLGFNAF